jgi:hypothetical protein
MVNYAAIIALASGARADDMPEEVSSKDLTELIVHSTQGWGELGVDVAAHAANTEAMPLRIRDTIYKTGLGTHAPGEIMLLLDGQYLSFEAEAGVQWQGDSVGSVVMQAFVDNQKVFDSGVLRETSHPLSVSVDLTGAGELRLVVSDAGDQINGDLGNWANAKLVKNPAGNAADPGTQVDIAPFACVASWDPARVEGTKASRLEPMPEDDLFMRTELAPDAQGVYEAKVYADGRACIGLEWLERRRVKRLELDFTHGSAVPGDPEVQYWEMSYKGRLEGGSRWQGRWVFLPVQVTKSGNRWVMLPDWSGKPEARTGALKLRFVFPAAPEPLRLADIRAITFSRFEETRLTLRAEGARAGAKGEIEVYNGALEGVDGVRTTWNLEEPLGLNVRYAVSRPWQLSDRTVLRFTLPGGSFGVAVDDVVESGPVYVAHAGLLVSTGSQPQDHAAYRETISGSKGILAQVRLMPDQTSAQAMEHVYIPESSLAPTMISLANDNRKLVVERNGNIAFESDMAVYNSIRGLPCEYGCKLAVGFGGDQPENITRGLQRAWLPILVTERSEGGVALRQRTFVAPVDDAKKGAPIWLRERALGVAEFRASNTGGDSAKASFTLHITGKHPEDVPTTLRVEGNRAFVNKGTVLLAVVETGAGLALSAEGDHALRIEGLLAGGAEACCVVYLPIWEGATAEHLPPADATDDLVRKTEAYWETVVAGGMQIEVPDPLINDLFPASVMHCMLAARNEQGRTVAPWIATLLYGPWDSEAQAVIRGMHTAGQMDFARRGLEYYIERFNDEGYMSTGYTLIGTGWHLWSLGEFHALTGGDSWLREAAPTVDRACRWVMAQRDKTKRLDVNGERVPEYGLVPPGVMADWDAFNYYFYMNALYYSGLESAGTALSAIDWPGAQEILDAAAEYREEIRRAYSWVQEKAPVVRLRNGTWVPFYPTHVYSPCPIEHLYAGEDQGRSWIYDIELGAHHLVALGIIDPASPEVDWMISHMEDVQFLRPGWGHYENEEINHADWFNLGGFSKCQPYYARTGEIHALRDDVKPFIRTYFNSIMSLLNKEDLALWEHFVGGSYNKTHETSYYLHQTRLMFVQERGDELWLAPFVTNNWLRDKMRVAVDHAPTFFGPVSYAIASCVAEGHIDAEIVPPQRQKPKAIVIRLRHPDDKMLSDAEVAGASNVEIDASSATIRMTPGEGPISVRAIYAD